MLTARQLLGFRGDSAVRLRPAVGALALAVATLAAVPVAAQVTVSFEHAEYSVPEGYFPDGSISYAQVNIFLSRGPEHLPERHVRAR